MAKDDVEEAVITESDLGTFESEEERAKEPRRNGIGLFSCIGNITLVAVLFLLVVSGSLFLLGKVLDSNNSTPYTATPSLVMTIAIPVSNIPSTDAPTEAPTIKNLPTSTVVPSPTATPAECKIVVFVTSRVNANVRKGPGAEFGVLESVPSGTILPFLGLSADSQWVQVGAQKWISATLLSVPQCSY